MRSSRALIAALALAAALAGTLQAQFRERPSLDRATAELVADATSYEAGSSARLAAVVQIEDKWHLQSNTPTFDYLIPTVLELEVPEGWSVDSVEYPAHTMWMAEFEEVPLAVYEGEIHILASLSIPPDAPAGPVTIDAVLDYQACDDRQCLPPTEATAALTLTIGEAGTPQNAAIFDRRAPGAARPAGGLSPLSLAGIVGLGLLGGLILNAMPCVLPILSLKLFGLVEHASQGKHATRMGALATTAGILVSFWFLALAAVLARNAGQLIGWGVQFQNPAFVTFLAVVVLLFCLNLWGLFEIPLPQRLARSASGAPRDGLAGHFATGLFATLMATPCSAPFLGSAVGFALGQTGAVIFLVFTAVGASAWRFPTSASPRRRARWPGCPSRDRGCPICAASWDSCSPARSSG